MSDGSGQPDKMAEVAGLAAAIAERILEQHTAGTSISPSQFNMLVTAARLLQDNGVPWPPSVELVVMEVARRAYPVEPDPESTEASSTGDDAVVHLKQFRDASKRRDSGDK